MTKPEVLKDVLLKEKYKNSIDEIESDIIYM